MHSEVAWTLESAYTTRLIHEFQLADLKFKRQVDVPITYKGPCISCSDRADLVIEAEEPVALNSSQTPLEGSPAFGSLAAGPRRG
jgi:GxxExxY protein